MSSCIFTVIKNEHNYIKDFIDYHLLLGIDHIFIFEDIGSITHKEIIDNYPKDKITLNCVNILNLEIFNQSEYIKSGLLWIRDNFDYDWCFSIDCDEFITVTDEFPKLLNDYIKHDAIMLQWKNYGASGYIYKPKYDKPIWEIYTKECGYTYQDKKFCNYTKLCFNMKRLQERFITGNHTALCNFVRPDFTWKRNIPVYDRIYLRHYITKSFEEYVWKLKIRGMMCKTHRDYSDFFEMNEDMIDRKNELIKLADNIIKMNRT